MQSASQPSPAPQPSVSLDGLFGLCFSVALYGTAGLSFLLAFGALRTSNQLARRWFSPKAVFDAVSPERHGGALKPAALLPVAWLGPLMRLTEEQLLAQAGLDAVVYLRLFSLGARLFSLLSVILVPMLIPLFWTAGGVDGSSTDGKPVAWAEAISAANVPRGSDRVWACVAAAWFVTASSLLLLRGEYRHVATLRLRQLQMLAATPEAYTLLCLDIPGGAQRAAAPPACGPEQGRVARGARAREFGASAADLAARAAAAVAYGHSVGDPAAGAGGAAIEGEVMRLQPFGCAVRAVCVPHLPPVEAAFAAWTAALGRAREACVAASCDEALEGGRWCGNNGGSGGGGGDSVTSPLLTPDGGTTPAVATLWRRRWTGAPEAGEAARVAGAARCALIRAQRSAASAPSTAAFLVFASRRAAATAAHGLLHPNPLQWRLAAAPAPGEVLWQNLRLRWWERRLRGAAAATLSAFVVLFFLVPVTAISSLATLEKLRALLPPLARFEEAHPAARGALQDALPGACLRPKTGPVAANSPSPVTFPTGLALTTALSVVPYLFGRLAKRQGCVSVSQADRQVSSRVFAVLVLDVFLGATVAHALVNLILALTALQWDVSLQDVLSLLVHDLMFCSALFCSVTNATSHAPRVPLPPIQGTSVPASAPLFVSFIVVRTLAGLPLELSRLSAMAASGARAALQQPDVWAPGRLPFGTQVPNALLIALLGLGASFAQGWRTLFRKHPLQVSFLAVYAPIAPLVLPFTALFFLLGAPVWRYQVRGEMNLRAHRVPHPLPHHKCLRRCCLCTPARTKATARGGPTSRPACWRH